MNIETICVSPPRPFAHPSAATVPYSIEYPMTKVHRTF